jgi:segregation and condensation protein B
MPELTARLTAILFVASEPVTADQLAKATQTQPDAVKAALQTLSQMLATHGLQLVEHHHSYRLVTQPEISDDIRRFLSAEASTELTRAALETLAIIAYRGPITKSAIETIRGVASDTMLRNLMQRGLVVEQGTAPEPGKPVLYAVSHTFLQQLGLRALSDLPPLTPVTSEESS